MKIAVTHFDEKAVEQSLFHTWSEEGGTIGRHNDNDWVLPDAHRFLSGQHAVIECRKGDFWIRDTSTNGVFVNHSKMPIGKGNAVRLETGDQLRMGQYLMAVSIDSARSNTSSERVPERKPELLADELPIISGNQHRDLNWKENKDPFDFLTPGRGEIDDADLSSRKTTDVANHAISIPRIVQDGKIENDAGGASSERRHQKMVVPEPGRRAASNPAAPAISSKDEFSELFSDKKMQKKPEPPEVGISNNDDLGHYFLDEETPKQPVSMTSQEEEYLLPQAPQIRQTDSGNSTPAPAAAVTQQNSEQIEQDDSLAHKDAIHEFLKGAGIRDAGKLVAIAETRDMMALGKLFRITIQGTLDVLHSRAEIKSSMRMDMTTIQSIRNNPLKFAITADDALLHVLLPMSDAYLAPAQALQEAYDDIRAHQMAMVAGIQAALKQVLKRFDPDPLVERLEKNSPIMASIPIQRQAKLWQLFEELYTTLEEECQDDFQRLFGQEFAMAYEAQIEQLREEQRR